MPLFQIAYDDPYTPMKSKPSLVSVGFSYRLFGKHAVAILPRNRHLKQIGIIVK